MIENSTLQRVQRDLARPVRDPAQVAAVKDAYKIISSNLNVMGGGDQALLRALAEEHPTLLGQLLNTVLDAVALHAGDGRFSPVVHEIARDTRNWFV